MSDIIISKEDISVIFPPLPQDTHKYSMGRVLCICGSYQGTGAAMCGAAYFSAAAAYRTGSGIVEIFTERKNYESLGARLPEAVFSLYDTKIEEETPILHRLSKSLERADAVIIGCGLGQSEMSRKILRHTLRQIKCPLVIDADGLNLMAENRDYWRFIGDDQKQRTVITPHAGEMARLCRASTQEILADPKNIAMSYAGALGIVCLLKGHRTIITDGQECIINTSGNPGMATAGSGDVLSGIIASLLARKTVAEWADGERLALSPILYRTAAAAYIHGLAGDLGAKELGQYSLMASDIIAKIPEVIKNS
ncbi:MAG: NAD(P)H-hydrate dehydratase [Clostridia bacterium]|nr:NAD(P)H-hydrate dehydratase [Clostridia bacterium]